MGHPRPPKRLEQFLRWFCHPDFYEELQGDLYEDFYRDWETKGRRYARRKYAWEVIRLLRPSVIKHFKIELLRIISSAMLKNYLKIALRSLWKYKVNSAINLTGLTIGLTGCLLIALFVKDELSFDHHHPDGANTYRVYNQSFGRGVDLDVAGTSPMVGPTLEEDFPEVVQSLRLYQIRQKQLFKNEDQTYLEEGGFFAEPSIFDLFHLPFEFGNPDAALESPQSIVLTSLLAKKYFGDDNPVGQNISINGRPTKITGVLKELPPHFHLPFQFLVSFNTLQALIPQDRMQSWVWQDFLNYIRLKPGTDSNEIEDKLVALAKSKIYPQTKEMGFYYHPRLQLLKDIHLHSANFRNDVAIRGNHRHLTALRWIGFFILLMACINFINLTTARAVNRAREVGVRKAAGAFRQQLAAQFIGEAVLLVMIALVISFALARLLLPHLNQFTDKSLTLHWLFTAIPLFSILGICLLTGVLAGSYPAFVISGFRPVEALKGKLFTASSHIQWFRRGLVLIQFSLAMLLMISVLIISQQIWHLNNKELGFQKEQLLHFPMKGTLFQNTELAKGEFLQIPSVTEASACFGIPGDIVAGDNIIIPGENRRMLTTRLFAIDHDYIPTMGMEVVAGRGFSKEIPTDAHEAFIINETAITQLELGDSPERVIGQPLEWPMWSAEDSLKKGRIIGVVKDFHYANLHEEIQSAVLHIYPESFWKMALRIKSTEVSETIAQIEAVWNRFETGYPLDFQFVDAGFGAMYETEEKWSSLVRIFTILAILIAGIGALGLASYTAEQKRKEIGIRKILGASVTGIVGLLSRDFLWLILLAILITTPISWYLLDQWLDGFAYRIAMPWWSFLAAGLGMFLLTLLVVGSQGLRAALGNPIKTLRDE